MKLLLIPFLFLCGCVTIVSMSQSDLSVQNGHMITADDDGVGGLELTVPTLSTAKELAKQCPGGHITGVESILQRRDFTIVQIYSLHSTASCQEK